MLLFSGHNFLSCALNICMVVSISEPYCNKLDNLSIGYIGHHNFTCRFLCFQFDKCWGDEGFSLFAGHSEVRVVMVNVSPIYHHHSQQNIWLILSEPLTLICFCLPIRGCGTQQVHFSRVMFCWILSTTLSFSFTELAYLHNCHFHSWSTIFFIHSYYIYCGLGERDLWWKYIGVESHDRL